MSELILLDTQLRSASHAKLRLYITLGEHNTVRVTTSEWGPWQQVAIKCGDALLVDATVFHNGLAQIDMTLEKANDEQIESPK